MFWKYNSSSSVQIDALLQQQNVSLQELMDEEELLQECIAQNKKVIDYLTQPDTLEALVTLLVTDPSPDRELKVRFKYANLASELLTSDVPAIVDKVASSSNLLQMLYKFLERDKPLNPLLASFVSKVFGMLVQRRSEQNWYSYQFTCFQVLDFLKSQGDFVELAVKHIGTSAIMDLLSKLICGVDDDDQEIKQGIHQWLNECRLIEQLIEKLSPDCDSEEHSSVDQLLCELVAKGQDPAGNGSDSQSNGSQSRLLATLESKEVINKLMDILLHEERSESSVSHVINILLTLLSYKGSHKQSNLHHSNSLDILDADVDSRSSVLKTVVARLPDLQKILKQPTKLGKLTTAFGMDVERLGSTRLKVVSLISALIATQDIYVHTEMASLCTLQLLFELFFKFSLNNFLHSQVTLCVTCILSKDLCNGNSNGETKEMDGLNNNPQNLENGKEILEGDKEDEIIEKESELQSGVEAVQLPLLIQLFSECKIIQKILECYAIEEEVSTEKRLHNMVGYMGHIREIANTIVQSSREGTCARLIQEELKKLPNDVITQWEEFTLIPLAEVNLKNKVIPLQMPGVLHRDSEDDSEEEFYSVESLVIMNKGFKEGDMDTMGDMRFVDDFKDAEESLNGGSQRFGCQMTSNSNLQEMNFDDGTDNNQEKFEEMCAERNFENSFDEIWKDKEKKITFQDIAKTEEETHHSSSEEEGDIDDEFDTIRTAEEKMDVEFPTEEWSEVFDKRGNALNEKPGFNPWQSAPASETSGSNSWADFGGATSPFDNSVDPFSQPNTHTKTSFGTFPDNSDEVSTSTRSPKFQADFSNVFFSSPPQEASSETFQSDFNEPLSHITMRDATAIEQCDPIAVGGENLQNVCDASNPAEITEQNVMFCEEMSTQEVAQSDFAEVKDISDDDPTYMDDTVSANLAESSFEIKHDPLYSNEVEISPIKVESSSTETQSSESAESSLVTLNSETLGNLIEGEGENPSTACSMEEGCSVSKEN